MMLFLLAFMLTLSTTPEPRNPWEWAAGLSGLRQAASTGVADGLLLFEPWTRAPSPFPEQAALILLPAIPEERDKKQLLRQAASVLEVLPGPKAPGAIRRWLTENPYWAPSRLALIREYIPLLPMSARTSAWELLWDVFPGHPDAFSFLLSALEAARNSGQNKAEARLERVVFLFLPHMVPADRKKAILDELSCVRREHFIRIAFAFGHHTAVADLLNGCPNPEAEARMHYHLEKYDLAMALLETIPDKEQSALWRNRITTQVVPPAQLAQQYHEQWQKDRADATARRLVKSRLLAGEYQRILQDLEKETDARWNFHKGYAAYRAGRKPLARLLLSQASPLERPDERVTRLYWLSRVTGKNELANPLELNKPIHAFYRRQFMLRHLVRADRQTMGIALPLLRPREKLRLDRLRTQVRFAALPGEADLCFALWTENFSDSAGECVLELLSSRSPRSRGNLELWTCSHLLDGQPHLCPTQPAAGLPLPSPLLRTTALAWDLPSFIRSPDDFLPQPQERYIAAAAKRFDIPKSLLWAIMFSESSFNPRVISRAGALGLFQVIPPTGTQIAEGLDVRVFHPAMLFEPENAVLFGAWYLHHLATGFNRNWPLVAAAYNAGPHQVRRWLKREKPVDTDSWVEEIPFDETRKYVKLVLGRMVLYARQVGEPPPVWPRSVPITSWKQ